MPPVSQHTSCSLHHAPQELLVSQHTCMFGTTHALGTAGTASESCNLSACTPACIDSPQHRCLWHLRWLYVPRQCTSALVLGAYVACALTSPPVLGFACCAEAINTVGTQQPCPAFCCSFDCSWFVCCACLGPLLCSAALLAHVRACCVVP
jgi:hypothetical protein